MAIQDSFNQLLGTAAAGVTGVAHISNQKKVAVESAASNLAAAKNTQTLGKLDEVQQEGEVERAKEDFKIKQGQVEKLQNDIKGYKEFEVKSQLGTSTAQEQRKYKNFDLNKAQEALKNAKEEVQGAVGVMDNANMQLAKLYKISEMNDTRVKEAEGRLKKLENPREYNKEQKAEKNKYAKVY